MQHKVKGVALAALSTVTLAGCGWLGPPDNGSHHEATSDATVAHREANDDPSPSSTDSPSSALTSLPPADFPDNATQACDSGSGSISTTDDNTRQIEGGDTSCDLIATLENQVLRHIQDYPTATTFSVEALSTKVNAMRKFDCKRDNHLSYCVGRKPSEAKIWVRDIP